MDTAFGWWKSKMNPDFDTRTPPVTRYMYAPRLYSQGRGVSKCQSHFARVHLRTGLTADTDFALRCRISNWVIMAKDALRSVRPRREPTIATFESRSHGNTPIENRCGLRQRTRRLALSLGRTTRARELGSSPIRSVLNTICL